MHLTYRYFPGLISLRLAVLMLATKKRVREREREASVEWEMGGKWEIEEGGGNSRRKKEIAVGRRRRHPCLHHPVIGRGGRHAARPRRAATVARKSAVDSLQSARPDQTELDE